MSLITINVSANDVKLDEIILLLHTIGDQMSDQQVQIDELTTQVTKVFNEVTGLKTTLEATIVDLEAQIAAAGVPLDLTALKAAIQSIDNIVPDPVVV